MKRLVSELSNDELEKVFNNNDRLYRLVAEDLAENEMLFIGDQLDMLEGLSSWSIGQYNRDQHMHVKNPIEFIRSLITVDDSFGVFSSEGESLLEKAGRSIEKYIFIEKYSDEYIDLKAYIDEIADELADLLVERYSYILNVDCVKENNLLDYFIEFYSRERLDDSYYIDSEYILYRDVSYTKSFK